MALDFGSLKALNAEIPRKPLHVAKYDYEETLRHTLQSGDLVFFSGFHWLSGLIRFQSKSMFSHVGMVLRIDEIDRVFLIESVIEHGVRLVPLSCIFNDYAGNGKGYQGRILVARHRQKVPAQDCLSFATSFLTKQYDKAEYLRGAYRMLVGRVRIFADKKLTCSELIYEVFRKLDMKLNFEKGNLISPGVIYRNNEVEFLDVLI